MSASIRIRRRPSVESAGYYSLERRCDLAPDSPLQGISHEPADKRANQQAELIEVAGAPADQRPADDTPQDHAT
ncbi:hypothetical protein KX816_05420 [Sphingosinicellaceae bacterium]|nr:hypothetical protein KX816_05420 [Sphingosinicellaceae bacterium]